MPNTFTITSIDREKCHVTVRFSVDGEEQTMGDAPIKNAKELVAFLADYGAKYELSLEKVEEVEPKKDEEASKVDALVGKTFPVAE
mgnify:CR=1 FL=1